MTMNTTTMTTRITRQDDNCNNDEFFCRNFREVKIRFKFFVGFVKFSIILFFFFCYTNYFWTLITGGKWMSFDCDRLRSFKCARYLLIQRASAANWVALLDMNYFLNLRCTFRDATSFSVAVTHIYINNTACILVRAFVRDAHEWTNVRNDAKLAFRTFASAVFGSVTRDRFTTTWCSLLFLLLLLYMHFSKEYFWKSARAKK